MRLPLVCVLAGTAFAQQQLRDPSQQQPLYAASLQDQSSHTPSPWRADLLALHRSLIEIESITGNENNVGRWLADYLTSRGYVAELQLLPSKSSNSSSSSLDAPKRYNVVAWRGEERPTARILLSSHIDTVPPYIPYGISSDEPTEDTVITGRGSCDAKASVAAQLIAFEDLLVRGEVADQDVMLLYVVGEETSGDGMKFFSSSLLETDPTRTFDAAIFGEPTEGKLACGHKGALYLTLVAKGVAGHSGYPWLGKSANELLVRALAAILDADLGTSKLFGKTTVNVGMMDGGVAANVIPAHAEAMLVFRVAIGPEDGGSLKVEKRVRAIVEKIDSDAFEYHFSHGYGTVETDCEVEGFDTITVNYGTDVPNLKGNHTRYLYGPGTILVAHSPIENVTVGVLESAVDGYQKLILHALKQDS